jgi:hypothetical protein
MSSFQSNHKIPLFQPFYNIKHYAFSKKKAKKSVIHSRLATTGLFGGHKSEKKTQLAVVVQF